MVSFLLIYKAWQGACIVCPSLHSVAATRSVGYREWTARTGLCPVLTALTEAESLRLLPLQQGLTCHRMWLGGLNGGGDEPQEKGRSVKCSVW